MQQEYSKGAGTRIPVGARVPVVINTRVVPVASLPQIPKTCGFRRRTSPVNRVGSVREHAPGTLLHQGSTSNK